MSLQPSEEPSTTIARLNALLDVANDRLSEYDKVIVPKLRTDMEQLQCDLTHEVGFRERAERERDKVTQLLANYEAEITHLRAEVEHLQLIEASWIALKSELKYTPGGDLWPRAERVVELEQTVERVRRERDERLSQREMEILLKCIEDNDVEIEQLERERDEALEARNKFLDAAQDGRKQLDAEIMEHCLTRHLKDGALAQVALLKRELQLAEDAEDLLRDRLQRAEAVVNSRWEHRCSDAVGGCIAISAEALAAHEASR